MASRRRGWRRRLEDLNPPSTPARSSWLLRPGRGATVAGHLPSSQVASGGNPIPRRVSSPTTVAFRAVVLGQGTSTGGGGLRWGLVFFLVDGLCCCDRIRGWSLLQSEFPKSGLAYARLFFRSICCQCRVAALFCIAALRCRSSPSLLYGVYRGVVLASMMGNKTSCI